MNVVYVTSNANKANYFARMVGLQIEHVDAEIDEIQTLDLEKIVRHKALAAYQKLQVPVIVEDTSLRLTALGNLPGPFIKWFIQEIGLDDVVKLADTFDPDNRGAVVGAMIAYFDGKQMHVFKSELSGKISDMQRGKSGFGWNSIFIPTGSTLTLGELSEGEFVKVYKQIKPFDKLRHFLDTLQP